MTTDPISETAKATQEIAKTAGKAVDATREVGAFISKFIAGPLEQGIGIFEDKLRYMRWERQVRLIRRAEETLQTLGLAAPTRAVPLKIAIPLLQAASVEDDDDLQDRWVNLLVNAANAGSAVEVHRSFVEILSQITSLEAKILDVVYSLPFEAAQHNGVITGELPHSARTGTKDDKGDIEPTDDVKLAIGNLARVNCLRFAMTWGGGEYFKRVNATVLGRAFVFACRVERR